MCLKPPLLLWVAVLYLSRAPHSAPALAALKAHLRSVRTSAPLFDTRRFCRHLEEAFLEVAARQRRGEPPGTLLVRNTTHADSIYVRQ